MSHLLLALRSRRGAAERRALVVMAVLVLVWGYSWILAKMALAYCGPLELATLRTAIGTTALFPALGRVCKPVWPEHPWEALVVGVVQTSGFLLLNNWALSVGEPGKTSILVFTMPFWVLIFAWPLLGERIQGVRWVAVTLAAGGLLVILEPWGARSSVLGKLLAVLAGACWALGVVISKGLHNRHPVDVFNFTFWQMALGLIPMLAVVSVSHDRAIVWTPQFIALVLILGIVATAGGWIAWFYVLRSLPAGTTSMSSLGIPVVALLSSALQLGERPTSAEWIGMGLIALALALVSWDTIRRHQPVEALMGQE
jgi:drug/metabolite transporter (DMT)-like permease